MGDNKRLHGAIGYITPKDMLEGKQKEIHAQRDQKLDSARMKRKEKRSKSNFTKVAA